MAWLTIAKASEGHVAYGGGCNGLPHARALSKGALSRAVVVGGVGTTSTAQSRCRFLEGMRVRQQGHMST